MVFKSESFRRELQLVELTTPVCTRTLPILRLEPSFTNVREFKLLCLAQDGCCEETNFFRFEIIKTFLQIDFLFPMFINKMFRNNFWQNLKSLTGHGECETRADVFSFLPLNEMKWISKYLRWYVKSVNIYLTIHPKIAAWNPECWILI